MFLRKRAHDAEMRRITRGQLDSLFYELSSNPHVLQRWWDLGVPDRHLVFVVDGVADRLRSRPLLCPQHRCPVRQPQDGALRLTSNPVVFTLHFSIGTGDHLHSLRELARIRAFTMIELPPLVRAHGVSIQLAPT